MTNNKQEIKKYLESKNYIVILDYLTTTQSFEYSSIKNQCKIDVAFKKQDEGIFEEIPHAFELNKVYEKEIKQ